jgi:hypothetical protein
MSEDLKFKAGSNHRHDSLYKVLRLSPDEVHESEFSFFMSRATDSKNNDNSWLINEIENHLHWLNRILLEKGINCREDISDNDANITEDEILNGGSLVMAAMCTKKHMRNAYNTARCANNPDSKGLYFEHACIDLLRAIPSLLIVQEAIHERAILGDRARTKPIKEINSENTDKAQQLINLCKPEYLIIKKRRSNLSKSAIARRLMNWLDVNHGVSRSERTITRWIDKM